MASNTATWTVPVSGDTDVALRQHLAIHGLTDRDLPQYVEEAVRWRLFDQEKAASYVFRLNSAAVRRLNTGNNPSNNF